MYFIALDVRISKFDRCGHGVDHVLCMSMDVTSMGHQVKWSRVYHDLLI